MAAFAAHDTRHVLWGAGGAPVTPGNSGTMIGQLLGGYQLLSLLGAGGMAEVYLAKDPKLDREVAVKVLPASLALDAGYVERFRDEARRVAALNHPNIVPVYHYGEERGLLFLVMPVLRESLRDRMEREGILPVAEATRYVVQVAAALDAAHAQGLVHRDVKPENILINTDGRALLTDFGIAREASFLRKTGSNRTLAATGLPVGTPEYMAPEQLRAGVVDQRADIYALGSVLYELLTGTVPHEAPTPYEVAALVLTAPLTPPSRRKPTIWPELERVVMKALEADPDARYPNTRAFAVAVRDAVLHRDSSVSRLTMPAVSREMPAMASTLTLAHSAVSAPAAPAEPLETETAGSGSFEGSRPAWGDGFRPKRGGRKSLLVGAITALVLVGICGGSGVAFLNGLNLPFLGSGSPSPTAGNSGVNGTNLTPDATVDQATATATLAPTNTPISPTATAIPNPPALAIHPNPVQLQQITDHVCQGSVNITNTSNGTIRWSWTSITPSPSWFSWSLGSGGQDMSGMPNDPSQRAGSTDQVNFRFRCSTGQSYTVTIQDSTGRRYTLTMSTQ